MNLPRLLSFFALVMLALFSPRPSGAAAAPDRMESATAAGVPVRVIRVNLADPRVRVTVLVPGRFPGGAENFENMVARERPTIAVNGAYFSKTTLAPIGDIVIKGRLVHQGLMGTALAVTASNDAIIRRVTPAHAEDWSPYETVLACGPALVLRGAPDARPTEEGFHDPHVMGSAQRMGVGVTADRHLLIVNTLAPVTFERWSLVMKALGCVDAMNLDAGASLAMHYRGRTLVSPGRALTNVLAVYVDDQPRPHAPARVTEAERAAPVATLPGRPQHVAPELPGAADAKRKAAEAVRSCFESLTRRRYSDLWALMTLESKYRVAAAVAEETGLSHDEVERLFLQNAPRVEHDFWVAFRKSTSVRKLVTPTTFEATLVDESHARVPIRTENGPLDMLVVCEEGTWRVGWAESLYLARPNAPQR